MAINACTKNLELRSRSWLLRSSGNVFSITGIYHSLHPGWSYPLQLEGTQPASRCQIRNYGLDAPQGTTQTSLAKRKHELSRELIYKKKGLSPANVENRRRAREELDSRKKADNLERYLLRSWKEGDVYAPHDLSWSEMWKWRQKKPPNTDIFDALAINPLDEFKVPYHSLLSSRCNIDTIYVEHFDHVDVLYSDGSDKAQKGDRLTTREPTAYLKGDKKGCGNGYHAQCPSTSRNPGIGVKGGKGA